VRQSGSSPVVRCDAGTSRHIRPTSPFRKGIAGLSTQPPRHNSARVRNDMPAPHHSTTQKIRCDVMDGLGRKACCLNDRMGRADGQLAVVKHAGAVLIVCPSKGV
jgi:hypothetical protein